jgi:hypothetical protein
MGDWSWLTNLFSNNPSGGSVSSLGGLGSSGNMSGFTMPAASDAAQGAGVGSNPYGFSMDGSGGGGGGGSNSPIDPKLLQQVLSGVNNPQRPQFPAAGIAPHAPQIGVTQVPLAATLRGPLGKMVYGA